MNNTAILVNMACMLINAGWCFLSCMRPNIFPLWYRWMTALFAVYSGFFLVVALLK